MLDYQEKIMILPMSIILAEHAQEKNKTVVIILPDIPVQHKEDKS